MFSKFWSLVRNQLKVIRRKPHCILHNNLMRVGTVPIFYGYPYDDAGIATGASCPDTEDFARRMAFPYARSFDLGGCVVGKERSRTAWYCNRCRERELKWHKIDSRVRVTWLKKMIEDVSPGALDQYWAEENFHNVLRDKQLNGSVKEHSETERQLSARLDSWIQSQGVESDKTMHDIA